MFGAQAVEDFGDGSGVAVAPVVVGHDPLDGVDTGFSEERGGSGDEPGAGGALLVRVDLGVGEPAVVIDG